MHPMFLNQLNKITLYLCLLILFSCASVKAPQGGPLDSDPPKLKSTTPAILTNLNQGQQITLSFNEFIKEESLKNAIELFPTVNQKIDFEYYGKEVIITLPSNLDKDKTYVISLNSNLSDEQNVKLNENIVIPQIVIHPHSVSQESSTRKRARRVNSYNSNAFTFFEIKAY